MKKRLFPLMLCFFVMGFVDLVGIASNYTKADLGLSDTVANLLPSLVFVWFFFFSIPTSLLMNRIGRRKTVLLSLLITIVAMFIPIVAGRFWILLVAFSLLGIGNTLLQTALNPLVSSVVQGDRLASTLTFGQFVKAIASFMAPYLAMWGATQVIPSLGLGWRILFPLYMLIGLLATILLYATDIKEEIQKEGAHAKRKGVVWCEFMDALRLLGNRSVLLCFIAIIAIVGLDVGINTTAPKVLMERLSMTLDQAAFATSLYFIFRTVGCFAGSFLLARMKEWRFLLISILLMAIAVVGLLVGQSRWMLYSAIAVMGLANSNTFSIIFSRAMKAVPEKQNEVSGLLIMGLIGGAIFPPIMGLASDAMGQAGAILCMAVGVIYLFAYWRLLSTSSNDITTME